MTDGDHDRLRTLTAAERYTPELLQSFLLQLERTTSTDEVWQLILGAARQVGLPYVDFVTASGLRDWQPTLFIRMSYDANWMQDLYRDEDLAQWSYFRDHAMRRLTPILVGLEFADEYHDVPLPRKTVLREAAARGLRAGFSVPLRQNAPPQAALITYSGDHSRREMRAIVKAHGWALHAIAMTGHQRYLMHFVREFGQRNKLSPKQIEVLELIGRGKRDRDIADQLGITVSAVRQRLETLRQRTGLETRSELAALAMALGILADPLTRGSVAERQTHVEMDGVGIRLRPPRGPAPSQG